MRKPFDTTPGRSVNHPRRVQDHRVRALSVLVLMAALLLVGCEPPIHEYQSGQTVKFRNGYEVVVPTGWVGDVYVTGSKDDKDIQPKDEPDINLVGPNSRETLVGLTTPRAARQDIPFWRKQLASDGVGRFHRSRFEGANVDLVLGELEQGTDKRMLVIYFWAKRGPMFIQVANNPDIDRAVARGVSADELVGMALREIGLRKSVL